MNKRCYTGPHFMGIPAIPKSTFKMMRTTKRTIPNTRFFLLFSRSNALISSFLAMAVGV